MQGQTGPYIQNAFVRIQSIFRKAELKNVDKPKEKIEFNAIERDLIVQLSQYPHILKEAFNKYDPSLVANYSYTLAKSFHRFYHDCRILNAETEALKLNRLYLSQTIGTILESSMNLLGIEMPEYM